MMIIGNFIKEKRIEQGLRVVELSEKCGVSDGLIWAYEKNINIPSFERAEDIVNALGYEIMFVKKGVNVEV